jgi:hypothetical protein
MNGNDPDGYRDYDGFILRFGFIGVLVQLLSILQMLREFSSVLMIFLFASLM